MASPKGYRAGSGSAHRRPAARPRRRSAAPRTRSRRARGWSPRPVRHRWAGRRRSSAARWRSAAPDRASPAAGPPRCRPPCLFSRVVAPPDAVAATSVARRIGLPRRITTILEGESLLNDATALVTLRTALAAAGLVVAHGVGGGAEERPGGDRLVGRHRPAGRLGRRRSHRGGRVLRHRADAQAPHRGAGRHGAVLRRALPRLRAGRAGRRLRGARRGHRRAAARPQGTGAADGAVAPVRADQLVEHHLRARELGLPAHRAADRRPARRRGQRRRALDRPHPRGRPGRARHLPGAAAGVDDPVHPAHQPPRRRHRRPARPAARWRRRLVGRDARRGHPGGRPDPAREHPAARPARRHRPGRHRRHAAAAGLDPARGSRAGSTCAAPTRARTPCRRPPCSAPPPVPGCG